MDFSAQGSPLAAYTSIVAGAEHVDCGEDSYGDTQEDPTHRPEAQSLEYASVNKLFLLRRGWTRTSIKRILGKPDRLLVRKEFRQDRPECRYEMARVVEAERSGKIRFRKPPNRRTPKENSGESRNVLSEDQKEQISIKLKTWESEYRARQQREDEELRRQNEAKRAAFLRQCSRDFL